MKSQASSFFRKNPFVIFCLSFLIILCSVFGFLQIKKVSRDLLWAKWIQQSQKIRPGMSKDEVFSLMGQPTARASENRYEKEKWDAFFYRVPRVCIFCNTREVYVEFDPQKVRLVEVRPYEQMQFESDDWKKSTQFRRWCMVDDLFESRELINLHKNEVASILGDPDQKEETRWLYQAGPERGFGVDTQLFIIIFSGDIVTDVKIETD